MRIFVILNSVNAMHRNRILMFLLLVGMWLQFSCKKDDGTDAVNQPVITGIQPSSGPKQTVVHITGNHFSNDIAKLTVYVNGKRAGIISATETSIDFEVPIGAGDGSVSVVANGLTTDGPEFDFIYTITVSTFSGTSLTPGLIDGDPTVAKFNSPGGITVDNNNNLYVADEENHCIRRITPGGHVNIFAGTGIAGHQDGSGIIARFNNPTDIEFDPLNNYFYVADRDNHCIRKLNMAGDVVTIAGIPGTPGYVDAPGASARFNFPTGVALEGELTRVYITDGGNHCIRKMDDVSVVTTYAGSINPGQQDGNGASARFSEPYDICWDTAGFLLVSDVINHNVRRISVNRDVVTIAGTGAPGFLDGSTSQALLNSPGGLMAQNNEVFICDVLNNRIRTVDNNFVSTLAGDGTAAHLDGLGLQSRFNNPGGIVRNRLGEYFVTDRGNHCVRKIIID